MEMIRNYFVSAIRIIRRHPWFSVINILGLSLGMACAILILLWVHDELSFDNFHANGSRIYRINTQYEENRWESCPWAIKELLTSNYPEAESATWYKARQLSFGYGEMQSTGTLGLVSPEYLNIFSFSFLHGDAGSALADANSLVLTEKVANELFGSTDVSGKPVRFETGQELFVSAIVKDPPGNSHMKFDLLARPDLFYGVDRLSTWIVDCSTYVLLTGNSDSELFEQKISGLVNENDGGEWGGKMTLSLQPLRKIHTRALTGTDPIVYVRIFSIIAIIILLISCVNFINLSTSQSVARFREIAFRKSVGAKKKDIFLQHLSGSIILAAISMVFALIIAGMMLPAFGELTGKDPDLWGSRNYLIFGELLLVTILTGLLAGIYPSIIFTSFQPVELFKGSVARKGRGNRVRSALIIFQFSSAIILLICISVIMKQTNYISSKDIGLNRQNVITVALDRNMIAKYGTIKENLLKNMSVTNVSASSNIPLNTSTSSSVYWEGRSPEMASLMNFVCVDYDYFETLGMKIIEGRSFSKDFPNDANSYIINETALRLTGFSEPLGKGIALANYNLSPIIGIVKDFHGTSLRNDISPTIFFLFNYATRRNMFISISGEDLASALDFIESTIKEVVPGSFFSYRFLDDQFNEMYQRESMIRSLVKYFAILALFIASMGLLGLASFMAVQRTREFAVRKVVGAKPWQIMSAFFREFMILIGISNIIAWPVSYYIMNNWLASYSFRVNIGLPVFIFSGLSVLLIAFLVTSFHAYKTSRCNLAESLKYE